MAGFFVWRIPRGLIIVALVCTIALLGGLLNWTQGVVSVSRQQNALAPFLVGKVVVLDPGHGGPDPGSVAASGLLEKEVVLAVGLRLRDLLEKAGAQVVMTRDSDVDLSGLSNASLRERWRAAHRKRLEIAQDSGADAVISIHANAVPSSRWFGAQTFFNPNGSPENAHLASVIQRELRHITAGTERSTSDHVEHFLLNRIDVPAVLVEVGFLSNPQEAELLSRSEYQQKLAWAIFVGLGHFFAAQELPTGTEAIGVSAGRSAIYDSEARN